MAQLKLSLKGLTNKEFDQYVTLILGIADASDPVKSKFKPERDALGSIKTRLTNALAAEAASLLTKEIEKADLRRDLAISGFVAWIRSYRNFASQAKKDASILIDTFFKSMGKDISNMNYQAETATLNKMVGDCKNDAGLKKAVADLGADTQIWLTEIETANTLFQNTYQKRSSEMGLTTNDETFYKIRPEATTAIDELKSMISSRQKTAKADKLDTSLLDKAMNDIEATDIQYKQLIKATVKASKEAPKPDIK